MTTQSAEPTDVNGPSPDLKRVLGPRLLLLFIVGDILGAGIYAVTGEMALEVGDLVWVPFHGIRAQRTGFRDIEHLED